MAKPTSTNSQSPSKPSSKSPSKPPPPTIPSASDPLLTQENFEKELQALASKAREETLSKYLLTHLLILLTSGTLLSLAALYSTIIQLTLSPIYGGIPSSIHHAKIVTLGCFLGWSGNLLIRRHLGVRKPRQLLPIIAAYIPVVQFFLSRFSGVLGARYGPVVVEALTYLPLLVLSVSCTATALDELEINTTGRGLWISDALPGIGSYAFFKGVEYLSRGKLMGLMGKTVLFTRLGLQVFMTGLYALFAPSRLLLWVIPGLIHTALFNTHVPLPYNTAVLNASLAKEGWSLLERKESLTGYISVIESRSEGYRLMRCDHSLLGGEWLAETTNGIREPVYGVFVMLEAVRLVEKTEPVRDEEASALVVGLGIGTLPTALIHHGISTTIVEIDPAVHDFAAKYFNLPQNHTPVVDDALTYAADLVARGTQYDYIVHDVFTGGAEPLELFTVEFLSDLRSLLDDGGVIALNYAGDLLLPPARTTIQTILSVFPTCRAFREGAPPSPPKSTTGEVPPPPERDFTNLVIFCTKQTTMVNDEGVRTRAEINFRRPVQADYLNSMARRMFLMPKWEVDLEDLRGELGVHEGAAAGEEEGGGGGEERQHERRGGMKGGTEDVQLLRRNNTGEFVAWQQESALGHWAVMRGVVPSGVWEGW